MSHDLKQTGIGESGNPSCPNISWWFVSCIGPFFFAVEDEEDEVRRSAVKTVVGVILAPPQLRDGPQWKKLDRNGADVSQYSIVQ